MEDKIAEMLVAYLNASTAFTDEVGVIFPLVADEATPTPFAAYRIDEASAASKDGAEVFSVSVVLVYGPKEYLKAMRMKNTVKGILHDDTEFTYVFSDTGFDEETQTIVSIVNFTVTWRN